MIAAAQLRLIGAGIVLLLVGIGLWYLHHAGYAAGENAVQLRWDADNIRRDEAEKAALIAYANRINQAEARHDQDQAVIDKLHDDAERLHIHLPACPSHAAAGQNTDGSTGVLPDRVDALFAEFQARTGRLIRRCDQLNIDAIRANAAR